MDCSKNNLTNFWEINMSNFAKAIVLILIVIILSLSIPLISLQTAYFIREQVREEVKNIPQLRCNCRRTGSTGDIHVGDLSIP